MPETISIEEFIERLHNNEIILEDMKPVVLGLYCYRQMSDKLEYYMNQVLLNRQYDENLQITANTTEDSPNESTIKLEIDEDIRIEYRDIDKRQYNDEYPIIKEFTQDYLGYFIEPYNLYSEIHSKLNRGQEIYKDITNALNNITRELIHYTELSDSIEEVDENQDKLNIFQDINLKIFEDKKEILYNIIQNIGQLDFNMKDDKIVIENYEYLADYFSKRIRESSEHYTPQSISNIIADIVAPHIKENTQLYDPALGTGSTIIEILKKAKKFTENRLPSLSTYQNSIDIYMYGNEINQSTYNQAIMNMIIHNVPYNNIHFNNTDTISHPQEYKQTYDIITTDLPLYRTYPGDVKKLSEDKRYKDYPITKRSMDYLFILDMLYNLKDDGIIVTTVHPRTLFTEGSELKIRKQLLENNLIDAVIKLPRINLSLPLEPSLLIIKKKRQTRDILFIDASEEREKRRKYQISPESIQKILETYHNRQEINKYSRNVSLEEIKEYNCNLTPKIYVTTYEETKIDIKAITSRFHKIREELRKNDEELKEYFKDKENIFQL